MSLLGRFLGRLPGASKALKLQGGFLTLSRLLPPLLCLLSRSTTSSRALDPAMLVQSTVFAIRFSACQTNH